MRGKSCETLIAQDSYLPETLGDEAKLIPSLRDALAYRKQLKFMARRFIWRSFIPSRCPTFSIRW